MKFLDRKWLLTIFFSFLMVFYAAITTGCPTPTGEDPTSSAGAGNKYALNHALSEAYALKDNTRMAGEDGFWDFSPYIFASLDAHEAFDTAIAAANVVRNNSNATREEIEKAVAALELAQFLFQGARYTYGGRNAQKIALSSAIIAAEGLLNSITVVEEHEQLVPGILWVNQSAYNAYKKVIERAIITHNDPSVAQTGVDNRMNELNAAMTAFFAAMGESPSVEFDKTPLEQAIAEAASVLGDVVVTTDAFGLQLGDKWALQKDLDAFSAAIEDARTELTEVSNRVRVNAAVFVLQAAQSLFDSRTNTVTNLNGIISIGTYPLVGVTVTANTSGIGGSGAFTYTWRNGNSADAANIVIGSNSSTYTPIQTDDGKYITVTVSRANNLSEVTSVPAGPVEAPCEIIFENNGGSDVMGMLIKKGNSIPRPSDPSREEYYFDGWYKDNGTFRQLWNFATDIASGSTVTLFAKWMESPWTLTDSGYITVDNWEQLTKSSISHLFRSGGNDTNSILDLFSSPVNTGSWRWHDSIQKDDSAIPGYFAIDLGKERRINKVMLNFNGTYPRLRFSSCYFAYTNDDAKWDALLTNNTTTSRDAALATPFNEIIGPDTGWTSFLAMTGLNTNNAAGPVWAQNNTWRQTQFINQQNVRARYVILIAEMRRVSLSNNDGAIIFGHMEYAYEE